MIYLTKIRIAFSSIVFIMFLLLFLGSDKISTFLSPILLPLQISPALIHVIAKPAVIFFAGLGLVLILTIVFGRVYCSFLCPLGVLQDFIVFISRKLKLRPKHAFQKPDKIIRYSLLGLTFVTATIGSLAILNILEPYSLFGRITNQIIEPLFVWIVNTVSSPLKYFDIYLFVKKMNYFPVSLLVLTCAFFMLILVMALSSGRLYCNTICPVGTLLGLISRLSVYKFGIDKTNCNKCRRCEIVCKAGCIDMANMAVDQSRCINCFNCLQACPKSVISYSPSFGKTEHDNFSPQRRNFLITYGAAAGLIIVALNTNIRIFAGNVFAKKAELPVTPPGSLGLSHYSQTCIACHLCVSACPTKVITPAFINIMQPKMDYEKSYCDYECNICGKVCPTGAILPVDLEEKKLIQLGEAELLEDRCIVYTKKQNCGACLEVCPTHTLYSVNKSNILYPKTDLQYCIGCGACEKACPTAPKSIIVRSNPIHKRAVKYIDKPSDLHVQKKKEDDKSFPF